MTTDTLTQEDFAEEFLDHSIPKMSLTDENDMGVAMEMNTPSPEDEVPPPPPPKEWRAAALPAPIQAPAKVPTPAPGPPRLKKKVPWRGKNILVLLPWDDERGQKGKAPTPMSEKDMAAMLKEWEQLGYDTSGFNLGPDVAEGDEGSQGQSRSPWPLVKDVMQDRTQRSFRVSIPNRKGKLFLQYYIYSWSPASKDIFLHEDQLNNSQVIYMILDISQFIVLC